jgi:flagellar biosynthesis protein FliR
MNDPLGLVTLGVAMVRPGMLVIATPFFGGTYVPPHIRIALTAILALLLMPVVQMPTNLSAGSLLVVAAGETVVGLALSMAVRVLVAGAELAGHVAGFQIGFSYASLVDPLTGARNNMLSLLYSSLTLVTLFGVNAHHELLRVLAHSFVVLPPGGWFVGPGLLESVTRLLGVVFLLGLQLAMPIVIVLLTVEVVLGLTSRVAPALNLMTLGFPLRVGAGLLALAVGIQVVPGAVARFVPVAMDAASRLVWHQR